MTLAGSLFLVVFLKTQRADGTHDTTLPLGISHTDQHQHQNYHNEDFHAGIVSWPPARIAVVEPWLYDTPTFIIPQARAAFIGQVA